MKLKKINIAILLVFALFFVMVLGALKAQGGICTTFGYKVISDSGKLTLKVSSDITSGTKWLGVTLYTPTTKEPKSLLYQLNEGSVITNVNIEDKFNGGTFELAVWDKKLTKEQCPPNDASILKYGYKLSDMQGYIWGYLK